MYIFDMRILYILCVPHTLAVSPPLVYQTVTVQKCGGSSLFLLSLERLVGHSSP